MKITKKALDGVNVITEDTETGEIITTLVHTYRPRFNLYDGDACIASYENDKEFIEDFKRLKQQNEFLTKRENKLQTIEQMYKSGSVNLDKLRKIVMEEK